MELRCDVIRIVCGAWIRTRFAMRTARIRNGTRQVETEDEMAGWHHRLNEHEFGQTLGVGDEQGGLACCGSWDCKESDTTERLN